MFKKNRKEAIFGNNEKERGGTKIETGGLLENQSLETSAVERTEKHDLLPDSDKLGSIRNRLSSMDENSGLENVANGDLSVLEQQINYLLILGKKEPVESLELAEKSGPYVLSEVLAELTFEE